MTPRPKGVTIDVEPAPWSTPEDYRDGRNIAWSRSRGRCEARTPDCRGMGTQVHHKAGRGFDGCHHPDLLLVVCGNGNWDGCHGYIHANRDRAEEAGWLLPHGTTIEDGQASGHREGQVFDKSLHETSADLVVPRDNKRDTATDIPDPF